MNQPLVSPAFVQLPAVCVFGVTVVITPLIALIRDQLKSLRARYIPCEHFSGSVSSTIYTVCTAVSPILPSTHRQSLNLRSRLLAIYAG